MNKTIKCILIDLDGTIINSGPDLIDSLNYVLKKYKLQTIQKDIIGSLVGGGAEAMIRKAYNFLDVKLPTKELDFMISTFLDYYLKNCTNKSHLYFGVANTLKILKSKYKLSLCTNKKQNLTEKILKSFNIYQYFDLILGSSPDLRLKPDIEMLEYSLKKFNIKPQNSIMVGDSDNDIIPATKLNMQSVFVTYGYGKLGKMVSPNYTINNFNELIGIV